MISGLIIQGLTEGSDPRGVVREFFRRSRYVDSGIPEPMSGWTQINVTESNYGAVRGLHAEETDKLIGIVSGQAFGVWIDARPKSETFEEIVTAALCPGTQVYVPSGVLNGWQSLASPSQYLYCFSKEWTPNLQGVLVNPLDVTLAIPWPVAVAESDRSQISEKDVNAPGWDATRRLLVGH